MGNRILERIGLDQLAKSGEKLITNLVYGQIAYRVEKIEDNYFLVDDMSGEKEKLNNGDFKFLEGKWRKIQL